MTLFDYFDGDSVEHDLFREVSKNTEMDCGANLWLSPNVAEVMGEKRESTASQGNFPA
jgi:hypothetical protein